MLHFSVSCFYEILNGIKIKTFVSPDVCKGLVKQRRLQHYSIMPHKQINFFPPFDNSVPIKTAFIVVELLFHMQSWFCVWLREQVTPKKSFTTYRNYKFVVLNLGLESFVCWFEVVYFPPLLGVIIYCIDNA